MSLIVVTSLMFVITFVYRVIVLSFKTRKKYKPNLISQTINTPSANVVIIVNNINSLREDNRLEPHDGYCKPDNFKSTSSPSIFAVNIISVPPKI